MQPPRTRQGFTALALSVVLVLVLGLATAARAEVVIVPPQQVLAHHTVESGGTLFFDDPEHGLYELVTEIDDPVIGNRGDGAFFPASQDVVDRALAALTFPLDGCAVSLFILPYPRRSVLVSSAGSRSIVLSPGVRPYHEQQLHALVAHEMGHIVHRQLLSGEGWSEYRALRGITDTGTYHQGASHKNRPHEIFAEDFRYLFGGADANYAGSIENRDLPLPDTVPGLREFFLSLVAKASAPAPPTVSAELVLHPNPTRAGATITFEAPLEGSATLDVFDVRGRRVRSVTGLTGNAVRWDGRDASGRAAVPGMYWVRVRDARTTRTGKLLIRR